jgi:lipopolysaccharide/colanic/teichoic acid biosynthesis glycosyltransferase
VPASAAGRLDFKEDTTPARAGRGYLFCKRLLDVASASVFLILSLPLLLVFACMIKLHDGGPVFHRRRVVGPQGAFDAFKLRSMRVDADAVLQHNARLREEFSLNFKLKNDPRVTPVGSVMRRWSVDELPQLWNVLCGQMSLVGPRMISPAELEKFASYQDRVKMELWYAEHRTLGLDLVILFKTPLRVLRGQGAS